MFFKRLATKTQLGPIFFLRAQHLCVHSTYIFASLTLRYASLTMLVHSPFSGYCHGHLLTCTTFMYEQDRFSSIVHVHVWIGLIFLLH